MTRWCANVMHVIQGSTSRKALFVTMQVPACAASHHHRCKELCGVMRGVFWLHVDVRRDAGRRGFYHDQDRS